MTDSTILYGGEIEILFDDVKHLYYVKKKNKKTGKMGRETWVELSVSAITKVLDKPALVPWAAKMCAQELETALPLLLNSEHLHIENTLEGHVYRLDEVKFKELIAQVKGAPRKKKEEAALIGTLAHEWCEGYVKAKIAGKSVSEIMMPVNPAVKASIQAFLQWEKDEGFIFSESERRCYSKKYGYAGTLDVLGYRKKKSALVDFKTSSGVYDEMLFQTAGYQLAYEEEGNDPVDERWIARFDKTTGEFEAKVFYDHKADKEAFLNCYGIAKRLKVLAKEKKNGEFGLEVE